LFARGSLCFIDEADHSSAGIEEGFARGNGEGCWAQLLLQRVVLVRMAEGIAGLGSPSSMGSSLRTHEPPAFRANIECIESGRGLVTWRDAFSLVNKSRSGRIGAGEMAAGLMWAGISSVHLPFSSHVEFAEKLL
jgi:hypothetical protein